MSKLEFKSKSLDYDLTNSKKTHIILVDDVGSVVHVYLDESVIDLPNAELYQQAMQKHYDINFPRKAENEKIDKVQEQIAGIDSAMDIIVAFAVTTKDGMISSTYKKIASVAKPLIAGKRYSNGDVVAMPYPYDTNPKWPKDTLTLFTFVMQASEGYSYKNQKVEDMLRQGTLTMVMPRID